MTTVAQQQTQELSRTRGTKPMDATVQRARVLGVQRVSPGFVRVRIGSVDGRLDFTPCGYDQWLRLFLPGAGQGLHLPWGGAEGWYSRWLAMDEATRPTIRNYTVREARAVGDADWEIDVDFVIHRGADGAVEGVAAGWALSARPGDELGFLDQGALLHAGDACASRHTYLFSDETGLPGVEGIAAHLPDGVRATAVVEVTHEQDRRAFPSEADLDVVWVVRSDGTEPGSAIRAHVESLDLAPDSYVYAVGEASFALAARGRALACGVPKDAIDFCAYWRPERRAARAAS